MIRYAEISPTMRAFLGAFEAFRKMGFRAEDIFCEIAWSVRFDVLSCFCKLVAQKKTFAIEVGPVEDADAFGAEYKAVTVAMNKDEISQEDLDRIWVESEPFQMKVEFVTALMSKGFKPPKSLS